MHVTKAKNSTGLSSSIALSYCFETGSLIALELTAFLLASESRHLHFPDSLKEITDMGSRYPNKESQPCMSLQLSQLSHSPSPLILQSNEFPARDNSLTGTLYAMDLCWHFGIEEK